MCIRRDSTIYTCIWISNYMTEKKISDITCTDKKKSNIIQQKNNYIL